VSVAHAGTERHRRGHRLATLGGGASLIARRVRLDPGPVLTMFALVAGTCFLFAALPRLFNAFADDGLRHTISKAPLSERNPRLFELARIRAGSPPDPLERVTGRAARAQHEVLPETLDELVAGRAVVVRSPGYVQSPNSGLVRSISLRVPAAGIEEQIDLVAGRLPRATNRRLTTVDRTSGRPRRVSVPVLEVALSAVTARELELHRGQQLIMEPDSRQALVRQLPLREQRSLAIEIVGIFDVVDPGAPFWFSDPTVDRPNVQFTPDLSTKTVFAQALVTRSEYGAVLGATAPLPLAYEYRYLLDEQRIDGGRLPELQVAANRIEARYANAGPLDRRVELGLGPVLDRFRSASSQAETLLAVAALGLLACALANLGLLGALTYERRRAETTVSRVRGASPFQVLGAQAAEVASIAVPAGLAGWAIAVLAVDARASSLSGWLVAAVVVGTIVLLVLSIAGIARRPLGSLAPTDVAPERPSGRRLALEALVACAALLGVYLLRRRGLEASGFGHSGRFDPYLAAVPVLLGVACGIAVLRLHPLPLRAAARAARRARGLALHLGLSRAARQPETTAVPVLVLVVAVALAAFSATMSSTIRAGEDATGWRAIGADLRIDAAEDGTLPESLIGRLASAGRVARAYVQEADLATGSTALLVALDARAYEAVVAGTPAETHLRRTLETPPPIPSTVSTVVSTEWPVGGNFQLPLPNGSVGFLPVGDRRSLPGIPRSTPFALVSLAALRKAGAQAPVNRLYVSHVDPGTVREAVRDLAPNATISTRAAVARSLRASPLVDGALRGFRWAVYVAALYAAVAIALLVLIAARSRSRDLALVRTMGGGGKDVLALSLVELTPLVGLGLALGIGLGIAIPYLIEPGLDLGFFTGSSASTIVVPATTVLVLAVALLLCLGVFVMVVSLRARRVDLGRVLRVGER
jgi:putative ABC transport system permease protein